MAITRPVEMKSLNSTGMVAGYKPVGSLDEACRLIRVINATTKDITISYDGYIDNDYLIAGASLDVILPEALWRRGTTVYAKGTAGTGFVFVTGYWC